MRTASNRRPGRQPMTEKRELYVQLMHEGMSNSAACRQLGIDRKTGHWWKNGGVVIRNGVTRVVAPITVPAATPPKASTRYLSEDERVTIADGVRDGRTSTSIAEELGRAVSTVARELKRNAGVDGGKYRPHAAHTKMLARRPRPRAPGSRWTSTCAAWCRALPRSALESRAGGARLLVDHGVVIATETISQALYSPQRVLQRDPGNTLRTRRSNRRRRRRGDVRLGRFVVPLTMIEDRPDEANDRQVPGHWEGDLIVGVFNRSAIGTLVERSTRFTILVHLDGASRAHSLRDQLTVIFNQLPEQLRRSLTWDQGVEMCPTTRSQPRPACPCTSVTEEARGSGPATRTPTVCCATTSRKAPTCASTPQPTSPGRR